MIHSFFFIPKYPDIKLLIELDNNIVDILQTGIDLALRTSKLEDSQLASQKICRMDNIFCASPNYLKKHGMPKLPQDLI